MLYVIRLVGNEGFKVILGVVLFMIKLLDDDFIYRFIDYKY